MAPARIVHPSRNGLRWRQMPAGYPPGVTCWRRHRDRTAAGVRGRVWRAVDATSVVAKGGAAVGRTECGRGMKLGPAVERHGIPLAAGTDAARVPEVALGPGPHRSSLRSSG